MELEKRIQRIEERLGGKATKVTILNITLLATDTEHHRQLPENIRGFRLQCRDGTTFRFAFESGKVGTVAPSPPYFTCLANKYIKVKGLNVKELHLYVSGTIAKVIEIIVWSKP